MIQKFWAGCISVLGIVFGEIVFMSFLILPPPFIQITLAYLESVWPYIIGLSLIIFIIFDLISNPYNNTMSIYQTPAGGDQLSSGTSPLVKLTSIFGETRVTQFLSKKLNLPLRGFKIFGFSFLLSLTEQSCYFSFFGSLNLSSTGNFLDTYLFAASRSPIILIFSCVGFLIGSFLAIFIYNLVIAKMIFLVASLGLKIKQYNPNFFRNWIHNQQTNFETSIKSSNPRRDGNNWLFVFEIYTRVKNNIISRLRYLFFSLKSKDSLKSLLLKLKNFIQLLISYLPGGKRIIFFLFPGQAYSYKSDLQTTPSRQWPREKNPAGADNQSKTQPTIPNQFLPVGFKTGPTFAPGTRSKSTFLSIETQIENMLRTDSFSMSSSLSSPISERSSGSGDPLFKNNQQSSGSVSSLGGSAFYNKIDKILLTCLITLSFTTIPYYSFDYLINSFFGFIPQDQILNAHSLRVNFPDYTNLLGITLSDNNSVINTDVSLYDRAHFMYGEWPNSFESLNYQGELMWTNLRDHRRQKRTRRSTRLKFKTLKTKISTSWKEFKLSSGFLGSTRQSPFDDSTKEDLTKNYENTRRDGSTRLSKKLLQDSEGGPTVLSSSKAKDNASRVQESLRNRNNLSNLFYKIFLAEPYSFRDSPLGESKFQTSEPVLQTKRVAPRGIYKNEIMPKIPEETRRSTSLSETIKPLSTSTFIDLSGGEKYIKTYPKNWKRVITEKYYQNPIYRSVLSNDLKNFLKREPLTQQLTNNQENELYFLRVKMAHYYDSLRFYFTLKEQINTTRPKADRFFKSSFEKAPNESKTPAGADLKQESPNQKKGPAGAEKIWNSKGKVNQSEVIKGKPEGIITGGQSPLTRPPFQFKSMTSMNYRQQFKGTLKTVKQLFAISLPESVPVSSNANYEQNSLQFESINANSQLNPRRGVSNLASVESNPPINAFSGPTIETQPIEKSYKYDKYLFNEYSYPKNEFLHEEGRGLINRKSTSSSIGPKTPTPSNEATTMGSRGNRSISLATKTIYNMFGSNDPFYVGWDQNLRKFVLTSRILSRSSALNYNTINSKPDLDQNKKPKPSQGRDFNNDSSVRGSTIANLTSPSKNSNNQEKGSPYNTPIYSGFACRSTPCEAMGWDPTKDLKKLRVVSQEEKKDRGRSAGFNQQSVHIYRPYTSWPFFKHQLKNLPNRPYFVLYENYLNILNKRIHLFRNININDIDTKSLTFLYSYSFNNNVKKYVSQLPINIYKQSMRPSSLENLFTPTSNSRSSFLWPGSTMPAWEYYFW